MNVRTKVSQTHQWLDAVVHDLDTASRSFVRDKDFVFGILAKSDHGRRLQV